MQTTKLIIEVCVDSVESAMAAERGGADRVELCDNLLEGGTTPSAGAIAVARAHLGIKLQVIIRPRGGDFCYSEVEFAVMQHDIALAKWVIFIMAAVAAAAAREFQKLRKTAGLLLIPYLAWLVFAATLNATIEALNPGAGTSLLG